MMQYSNSSFSETAPVVFDSLEEMKQFFGDTAENTLNSSYGYNGETLSEIMAQYSETYFEDHSVVLLRQETGSGTPWYRVTGIRN